MSLGLETPALAHNTTKKPTILGSHFPLALAANVGEPTSNLLVHAQPPDLDDDLYKAERLLEQRSRGDGGAAHGTSQRGLGVPPAVAGWTWLDFLPHPPHDGADAASVPLEVQDPCADGCGMSGDGAEVRTIYL